MKQVRYAIMHTIIPTVTIVTIFPTQASPTYIKTLPDPAAVSGGARKAVQDEDSAKIAHCHSFGDLGL